MGRKSRETVSLNDIAYVIFNFVPLTSAYTVDYSLINSDVIIRDGHALYFFRFPYMLAFQKNPLHFVLF